MVNDRQHAVAFLYAVRPRLCALAADHNDTRAGSSQRLKVPITILPENGETIVVQQRCKFLREGVAQRNARDPGVLLLALVPAFVGRPVRDLRDRSYTRVLDTRTSRPLVSIKEGQSSSFSLVWRLTKSPLRLWCW
jgi:hypothetical protein